MRKTFSYAILFYNTMLMVSMEKGTPGSVKIHCRTHRPPSYLDINILGMVCARYPFLVILRFPPLVMPLLPPLSLRAERGNLREVVSFLPVPFSASPPLVILCPSALLRINFKKRI